MKTALAVIRTRCNYSQTVLASVLGLSRQVVSAWENGNKKIPEGRLAELASLFGVPAALLTMEELDVVERWCDRPVFPTQRRGRQVFSFEPVGENRNVILNEPSAPMPAVQSRDLMQRRNYTMRQLAACTQIRAEQQTKDLSIAEPCITILEQIRQLFDTALNAEPRVQEQILQFVLKQILLLCQVLSPDTQDAANLTDWQKQQIQMLRTHWAAMNRERRKREQNHAITETKNLKECSLTERLNTLYHHAMTQGMDRRDLQLYLERIWEEEYERADEN